MPGDNCAVFGCGTNRRKKGIGIFKLPAPTNDEERKWRQNLLNEITKSRVVDQAFKQKIEKDTLFICEEHFLPDQIETCE